MYTHLFYINCLICIPYNPRAYHAPPPLGPYEILSPSARRDGRGLSRPRHPPRPRRGRQGARGAARELAGSAERFQRKRALPRRAEPPEHLRDLRRRRCRRSDASRDGAARRRDAPGAARARAAGRPRRARHGASLLADALDAAHGAGHRPPRHQAREHLPDGARPEDPRLRIGEGRAIGLHVRTTCTQPTQTADAHASPTIGQQRWARLPTCRPSSSAASRSTRRSDLVLARVSCCTRWRPDSRSFHGAGRARSSPPPFSASNHPVPPRQIRPAAARAAVTHITPQARWKKIATLRCQSAAELHADLTTPETTARVIAPSSTAVGSLPTSRRPRRSRSRSRRPPSFSSLVGGAVYTWRCVDAHGEIASTLPSPASGKRFSARTIDVEQAMPSAAGDFAGWPDTSAYIQRDITRYSLWIRQTATSQQRADRRASACTSPALPDASPPTATSWISSAGQVPDVPQLLAYAVPWRTSSEALDRPGAQSARMVTRRSAQVRVPSPRRSRRLRCCVRS